MRIALGFLPNSLFTVLKQAMSLVNLRIVLALLLALCAVLFGVPAQAVEVGAGLSGAPAGTPDQSTARSMGWKIAPKWYVIAYGNRVSMESCPDPCRPPRPARPKLRLFDPVASDAPMFRAAAAAAAQAAFVL